MIVSAAVSNWGALAARQHRFVALDKRTGEIVYVASPGGRPYDTNYSAPLIATINGQRLLISGSGDGAVHAIKPQTGEKVWSFVAAKRAINTGVVVSGTNVIISHGDENLDTSEMGMIAAIDGSQTGDIKDHEWKVRAPSSGSPSPVIDGQRRLSDRQRRGAARARARDGQRAVGAPDRDGPEGAARARRRQVVRRHRERAQFFMLRPQADRVEVVSEVELPISTNSVGGSEGTPEQIVSGAAISRGRVFFVSSDAVYAIGPKAPKR